MIAALTSKPQLVTRRLGNLAAIGNPEVQAVIWTRSLPASAFRELEESASGLEPFSFLSLTIDPFERVQQLRKAGLCSHFLACDLSLPVSAIRWKSEPSRLRSSCGSRDSSPSRPRISPPWPPTRRAAPPGRKREQTKAQILALHAATQPSLGQVRSPGVHPPASPDSKSLGLPWKRLQLVSARNSLPHSAG